MKREGFSLVELLVTIAIVATLCALISMGLHELRDMGRRTACISNLRQIGAAIGSYAGDHDGKIPYGPAAGGYTNAASFYPSTGAPTSLISLQSGQPVALGLLLQDYLKNTPKVLFCPGMDGDLNPEKELAKVGHEQAQGGYYYRHGGNTALFDSQFGPPPEPPLHLGDLGENSKGKPIRALVMDTIFLSPKEIKSFGVEAVSNHEGTVANVLYTDGHVVAHQNNDGRYNVDISSLSQVRSAFSKILKVFETADDEP